MATDAEKHVWENEDGDLVVVLDLPTGAREYVVADVSASTGRWVTRLTDKTMEAQRRLDAGEDGEDIDADLHLSDEAEKDLYEELLGSTMDDMEADGVRWKKVQLVGKVAYAWVLRGLEGARKVWEAKGEAPKANRAERRGRASGSRTKTGGASATTTKPRASTTRTKTRN
jgi:hypothetical protein